MDVKRFKWKDAEDGPSKQEAQKSTTEQINGWEEKKIHRIELDGDSRRGDQRVRRRMRR